MNMWRIIPDTVTLHWLLSKRRRKADSVSSFIYLWFLIYKDVSKLFFMATDKNWPCFPDVLMVVDNITGLWDKMMSFRLYSYFSLACIFWNKDHKATSTYGEAIFFLIRWGKAMGKLRRETLDMIENFISLYILSKYSYIMRAIYVVGGYSFISWLPRPKINTWKLY